MTEASNIQPGQTVALKSGGPAMTVQARSQNLAYCSWLEGGALQHGTFAVDSLQSASRAGVPSTAPHGSPTA